MIVDVNEYIENNKDIIINRLTEHFMNKSSFPRHDENAIIRLKERLLKNIDELLEFNNFTKKFFQDLKSYGNFEEFIHDFSNLGPMDGYPETKEILSNLDDIKMIFYQSDSILEFILNLYLKNILIKIYESEFQYEIHFMNREITLIFDTFFKWSGIERYFDYRVSEIHRNFYEFNEEFISILLNILKLSNSFIQESEKKLNIELQII